MSALAIVTSYNEADILPWTVRHLRGQGCDVLVIDCQSIDGSRGLARAAGASVELHHRPPVSWYEMLTRVEQAAAESRHDWIVHCDADEIRYSDLVWETLAEGFARVQADDYNAIDHTVLTFHPVMPIENMPDRCPSCGGGGGLAHLATGRWECGCGASGSANFDGTQDPEQHFRHYSGDALNQRNGQLKAWRNLGPVQLASSAGHRVHFEGRKIYPGRFLSKHYPIRSQAHGERKVFNERRWLDESQGRKNWHVQYADITPGHSFLKDPKSLLEWK